MSFIYRFLTREKQISPHVKKFEFDLGILVVSIWLVEKADRFYLIDTGMRGICRPVFAASKHRSDFFDAWTFGSHQWPALS